MQVNSGKSISVKWWGVMLLVCLVGASGCTRAPIATPPPGPLPREVLTEALHDDPVVSADGSVIGTVDGLVIGADGTEVAYIVVRIADIYAFGKGGGAPQDRFLLIPWARLTLDAQQRLIVDVEAAALAAAPTLPELPDPTTLAWDEAIRHFWAAQ